MTLELPLIHDFSSIVQSNRKKSPLKKEHEFPYLELSGLYFYQFEDLPSNHDIQLFGETLRFVQTQTRSALTCLK